MLCAFCTVLTFEDKRRENFEKGQAELERRRALMEEQRKKDAEELIAFQKREEEKREQARYETILYIMLDCSNYGRLVNKSCTIINF